MPPDPRLHRVFPLQQRRGELMGSDPAVPVVALIGNQDPMCPDDPAVEVLSRLPAARVLTVTGGHMTVFEQRPAVWAAELSNG